MITRVTPTPGIVERYAAMAYPPRVDTPRGKYTRYTPTQIMARCAHNIESNNGRPHLYLDSAPEWYGTESFAAAFTLAENGWPEGMRAAESMFDRVYGMRTKSLIPTITYTDEPDGDIDVGMWLSGEDEHWVTSCESSTASQNGSDRAVTIAIDAFMSVLHNASDYMRRGVILGALVSVLERSGYATEILMRHASNPSCPDRSPLSTDDITVKEFEQPLDLARAIFWIVHPSAYRRFALVANADWRSDPDYNSPIGLSDDDHTIIAPPITWQVEQIEQWLADTFKRFGIAAE